MNVEPLIVDIPKYFFSLPLNISYPPIPLFTRCCTLLFQRLNVTFPSPNPGVRRDFCDDNDDDDHGDVDHGDHDHGDNGHGDHELERNPSPNPGVRGDFCQALHNQHQPGRRLFDMF